MPIKPIRTGEDLRAAFHRLESIYQADEGTPAADERDVLVGCRRTLVGLIDALEPAERGTQIFIGTDGLNRH